MARKLASVQRIVSVDPIEGADRIEIATVLGWRCVVKKGEVAPGDLCVYFEIDSFLPIDERFEFLRQGSYKNSELLGEGFRLRTQKFRGQVSQGLVLPLSILPDAAAGGYAEGDDVTELLGVRKWEIPEMVTQGGTITADFPSAVPKTDETRVQAEPALIEEFAGKPYYITTKMDGTSVTMCRLGGEFKVCGHNFEYADDGKCPFWQYAHEHELDRQLAELGLDDIAIQGEFCGAGIQKNPLKLAKPQWYVFTVYNAATSRRYNLDEMLALCERLGLTTVPVEERGEAFPYKSVEELLERAKGCYESGTRKEGIVIRPVEPTRSALLGGALSMKVINNDYLLKQG